MRAYQLAHLSDAALLRALTELVAQDRLTTAAVLAHIAEVDERRLYGPAGYSSMHAYCVEELRFSGDAAFKRIQAARAAREFPILFMALADGRLHLTAVRLLAPHLTLDNVDELVAAATHRQKSEIEQLLARRFPRAGMTVMDQCISPVAYPQLAPGQVATPSLEQEFSPRQDISPGLAEAPLDPRAPGQVESVDPLPGSPSDRFALRLTIDRRTHDKLRYAQALLSHSLPSGDVAKLLDRALDALIGQLERHKFAACGKPRPTRPATARRHIPANVRRAVWERDQGQCTFVSDTDHRCGARKFLEFDPIDPVARGGRATVERMRLRCRVHNQYEAERVYGAGFIREKREQARARAMARAAKGAVARSAAAEDAALQFLCPKVVRIPAPGPDLVLQPG